MENTDTAEPLDLGVEESPMWIWLLESPSALQRDSLRVQLALFCCVEDASTTFEFRSVTWS